MTTLWSSEVPTTYLPTQFFFSRITCQQAFWCSGGGRKKGIACSHVSGIRIPPPVPPMAPRWLSSQILASQRGEEMSVEKFSREEHWKRGKPPLTPAWARYLGQDSLETLWPNLSPKYCSFESVLKRAGPKKSNNIIFIQILASKGFLW